MAEENSLEESGDIRRKALTRLGIAGIVTALALGALWWLDNSSKPAAKPKSVAPAPIVTAPVQVPTPGPELTEQPSPLAEPSTPPPEENPAAPSPETAEAPPPPSVHNAPAKVTATAKPTNQPIPAARTTQTAQSLPTQPVAPPAAAAPAPAATVANTAPSHASSAGYAVQAGIFSNPDNAKELASRLNAAGIHAYVETRVQVGPFANRAEAEKARLIMDKMGIKGLIGPAAARK